MGKGDKKQSAVKLTEVLLEPGDPELKRNHPLKLSLVLVIKRSLNNF